MTLRSPLRRARARGWEPGRDADRPARDVSHGTRSVQLCVQLCGPSAGVHHDPRNAL